MRLVVAARDRGIRADRVTRAGAEEPRRRRRSWRRALRQADIRSQTSAVPARHPCGDERRAGCPRTRHPRFATNATHAAAWQATLAMSPAVHASQGSCRRLLQARSAIKAGAGRRSHWKTFGMRDLKATPVRYALVAGTDWLSDRTRESFRSRTGIHPQGSRGLSSSCCRERHG